MLIASRFHDYYDGAGMMVDKSIVYRRETSDEESVDEHKFNTPDEITVTEEGKTRQVHVHFGIVGVCGKLYPYIYENPRFDMQKYAYNQEQLEAFLPGAENMDHWFHAVTAEEYLRAFKKTVSTFGGYRVEAKWLLALFLERRIPVFEVHNRWSKTVLVENPNLGTVEFFKVMPPVTIHQEISRFIGNDLAENRDAKVEMTDKVLAASKGFGHKYAFRKEPKE